MISLRAATGLLIAAALPLTAQERVPSPEEVLGYPLGERFTDHAGVLEYAEALAGASAAVEVQSYGETAEGRALIRLFVSRPDQLLRLDEVLAMNAELADPETTTARAAGIAAAIPAVVYFSYGVHGNEASSTEAALWTAYDLASGAPGTQGVLDSLVVIIDPNANPDGRARYVNWFRSVKGAEVNPDPNSREHREPWPGGRYNHYLFDLNRDWSWGTQPETRARLAGWGRLNPQVHVDFHEMGYESSYFFFPAVAPINPIYPEHVLEWGRRFGRGNASTFDARGWPYYTAESFDLFYPGYGDSWPSLLGAVGMTYEQAGHGQAGLAVERSWGDTLTLAERARHHRASGLATLRTAALGKSGLLSGFAAAQRTAGRGEPDFLLVPGADTVRARALADLLLSQGIEVERAGRPFSARAEPYPGFSARRGFPAGSYLVRARQPRGRLAITLLQPETVLEAEFSYDLSAWSLPYAYGVEAHRVSGSPEAAWRRFTPGSGAPPPPPPPGVGYLIAPSEYVLPGLITFLRQGGRVRVLAESSTHAERAFPAGTWFLPAAASGELRARVEEAGLGGVVVPVASWLSQAGIDLGSDNARPVALPAVALLSGDQISPTSFGAAWFYLEQRLGIPHDVLWIDDTPGLDLSEYDVIILPELAGAPAPEVADALKAWVEGGGRLVAVGAGARQAAGIFDISLRNPEEDTGDQARFLLGRQERESESWRESVPGTILPARLDPAHPLAWGAGLPGDAGRTFVLHRGRMVFEPAPGVESVAYFPGGVEVVSGVISAGNLEHFERGSWLVTARRGGGSVVLFAGDPVFRMFWHAGFPLFANAVLLGP
ncbi:MAG: M14 family metallopeptidase [Longimicrobiaceae bacterium]